MGISPACSHLITSHELLFFQPIILRKQALVLCPEEDKMYAIVITFVRPAPQLSFKKLFTKDTRDAAVALVKWARSQPNAFRIEVAGPSSNAVCSRPHSDAPWAWA
jgi:hypothetical protein